MEIRLNNNNLKSERIPFRGAVGIKLSEHNFSNCKITVAFRNFGDALLDGRTATIFDGMIEPELFWAVKDKTFDFVTIEIAEPKSCNCDIFFEYELLTSKGQLPTRYNVI